MILIFAVDNNWNIGIDGGMLTAIPDDLTRFRLLTEGNIVIMGRRTLEAIPGQNPLPDRENILITRNEKFLNRGFHVIHSLEDLPALLDKINPKGEMEVFVTGGESVVKQLMPYCNKAYITKILHSFPRADTSIPNLDLMPEWEMVEESEIFAFEGLNYKYVNYIKSQGQ